MMSKPNQFEKKEDINGKSVYYISLEHAEYFIHIDSSSKLVKWQVFRGSSGIDMHGVLHLNYQCRQYGSMLDRFDKAKVDCMMSGSYCWRGIWEERINMVDTEYHEEHLFDAYILFSETIKPLCKETIRPMYPDQTLDD